MQGARYYFQINNVSILGYVSPRLILKKKMVTYLKFKTN